MLTDKEQEEIRRKLLGLEEEPPTNGWSRISADIQPPKKPRPLWWLFGAALLLLLTTIGIYKATKQKEGTGIVPITGTYKQQDNVKDDFGVAGKRKNIKPHLDDLATIQPQPKSTTQTEKQSIDSERPDISKKAEKTPVTEENLITEHANLPSKPDLKARYNPRPVKIPPVLAEVKDSVPDEKYKAESIAAIEKDKTKAVLPSAYISGIETELKSSGKLIVPDSIVLPLTLDSSIVKETKTETDTDTTTKQKKEWYIGLTFSPRYAFKSVTPSASDEIYITNLNTGRKLDPERMGYEFGLNAGKMIKPKLYFETSLLAMQLRENVSYSFTTGQVDTILYKRLSDGTFKATPVYVEGERQLKSSFVYGGIRVGVSYYFLESARSRFNLTMGGGMNLLVKGQSKVYENGVLTETIEFPSENNLLEQRNFNLLVGAGYNTTLHNKYELMLMPSLNYFLGSTYGKREPFGIRPYTLGLTVQVKRRFY